MGTDLEKSLNDLDYDAYCSDELNDEFENVEIEEIEDSDIYEDIEQEH